MIPWIWPNLAAASPSGVVKTLYRALFNREPDKDGFEYFRALAKNGQCNIHDLAGMMMKGHEFVNKNLDTLERLPCITGFDEQWRKDTQNYYNNIANSGISLDHVRKIYEDAGLGEHEYTVFHIRRFHELFGYLKQSLKGMGCTPAVLEIGTSVHTTVFHHSFFDAEWDTICRPAATGGGLSPEWAIKAGTRHHWGIDLNQPEKYADILAEVPDKYYDIVICTEVIEHLTRLPRDTIGLALSKLKPNGFMYLTTPNLLRPDRVRAVLLGYSPAEMFSAYGDNLDAHHHFREYTPKEIIDETTCVPARVARVIFSNCWDGEKYATSDEIMFRSNLIFIIEP